MVQFGVTDQLTQVADPDATLSFAYDSGGRMTTARTSGGGTGQPNVTLTYAYNQGDARQAMTDSFGTVGRTTYVYDDNYRLATLTRKVGSNEELTVKNGYDDAGRLTSRARTVSTAGKANITTTFQYNNANRLGTITHAKQSGGTTLLGTFTYGYDSGGRITTHSNPVDGLTTYSHDTTNQLTGADRSGTDETYSYDLNGNRSMSGYATTTDNRLTAGAGYTFTYDNEGNMTARTKVDPIGNAAGDANLDRHVGKGPTNGHDLLSMWDFF